MNATPKTYSFRPLTEKPRAGVLRLKYQSVGICPTSVTQTGKTRYGPAVKRFRGQVGDWQKINTACQAFCVLLNALLTPEAQEKAITESVRNRGFTQTVK